jgi:hypothetical protein
MSQLDQMVPVLQRRNLFICVMMRYSDSTGPADLLADRDVDKNRGRISVMNEIVNNIATGALTSVLHVTPIAMTSTIWTIWPGLAKFHSGEPPGKQCSTGWQPAYWARSRLHDDQFAFMPSLDTKSSAGRCFCQRRSFRDQSNLLIEPSLQGMSTAPFGIPCYPDCELCDALDAVFDVAFESAEDADDQLHRQDLLPSIFAEARFVDAGKSKSRTWATRLRRSRGTSIAANADALGVSAFAIREPTLPYSGTRARASREAR